MFARAGLATFAIVGASIAACVANEDPVDGAPNGDAGADASDASGGEASSGCSLTVIPSSVVVEPGAAPIAVAITVAHNAAASEAFSVTLGDAPTGVTGSANLGANVSNATLNVTATSGAVIGSTATAKIQAVGNAGDICSASLFIRVGHFLVAADATTSWTVPTDVHLVTVAAWGGGGGAGANSGGAGGAGGFVQADVPVTGGDALSVIVAGGGSGGVSPNGSGGGGGYSGVFSGAGPDGGVGDFLVIAGGGGGGSTGGEGAYAGGGGGGTSGVVGLGNIGFTTAPGQPGTADAGGISGCGSGGILAGGEGYIAGPGSPCTTGGGAPGGVPGGGTGGVDYTAPGGGGGGAGYFGGGGGGDGDGAGGGGGGAGYAIATAVNLVSLQAVGASAPKTDHPYYGTKKPAVGGPPVASATGGAGNAGRVVIYLP